MLGTLIEYLEVDENKRAIYNFGIRDPHSWRGSYYELAVVTSETPSMGDEILEVLKSALDQVYEGYKGGDFTMHSGVGVHLEEYEYAYDGTLLTPWLLHHTKIGIGEWTV